MTALLFSYIILASFITIIETLVFIFEARYSFKHYIFVNHRAFRVAHPELNIFGVISIYIFISITSPFFGIIRLYYFLATIKKKEK